MNAFLDSVGQWLQSWGVHPVLGAFVLGAAIAFVFAYRRAPDPLAGDRPTPAPARVATPTATTPHTFQGQRLDIPVDVLEHLRNGRQIEAIKALRQALGIGLKDAKDIVDSLARPGS